MSTLKLVQSGGLAGKPRRATTEIDITENDLYDALKEIEKESNPLERDAFSYTAHIGNEPDEDGIKINPEKAKAKLKRALNDLIKNLKA